MAVDSLRTRKPVDRIRGPEDHIRGPEDHSVDVASQPVHNPGSTPAETLPSHPQSLDSPAGTKERTPDKPQLGARGSEERQ